MVLSEFSTKLIKRVLAIVAELTEASKQARRLSLGRETPRGKLWYFNFIDSSELPCL